MIQINKEKTNKIMIVNPDTHNNYTEHFVLVFKHQSSNEEKSIYAKNISEYKRYQLFELDESNVELRSGNHDLYIYQIDEQSNDFANGQLIETTLANINAKEKTTNVVAKY
ncbi:hypothetical protein EV201_1262 [Ancylomarina subtilis]|uniref:Uncharacterized protein n=1 Tax=Ancylomarina subtilis TaxID=1639035 RepID=A0A4Q7VK60_9BACT|nr:hypothetical protein [Ancylomarina subtilis]RZT96621.1 hypothetical protein EV201_1262 [Ancylomarina subtilis]